MRTLNEEIVRIKSEVANITSKAFTGKTIQERVEQHLLKAQTKKEEEH